MKNDNPFDGWPSIAKMFMVICMVFIMLIALAEYFGLREGVG